MIADALCVAIIGEVLAGRGCDRAELERALALEDRTRTGQLLLRPTSLAGQIAVYEGWHAEAEVLLRRQCEWAAERGEESEMPFLLGHLAWLECRRADFVAATRYAEEAIVLSAQSGSDTMLSVGLGWRAAARVGFGDVDGAWADIKESRALMDKTHYVQHDFLLRTTQGVLELSRGDAAAAAHTFEPLIALIEARALGYPGAEYFLPDAIEALIAIGQSSRAEVVLEPFAQVAEQGERSSIAAVARCRSLLAVAQGDLDVAVATAEHAVARSRPLDMPVELGRALLVLGQVQRRRGERRAAREALTEALTIFRRVGAGLWAERADEELQRIPIRRGAPDDLTPTEEQVATLAGTGKTNREIAQALFISPKTVEANLTRIYGKLAIRSRAELGLRMLERRGAGAPTKK